MELLGVGPSRTVGDALRHLLALRMEHGPLGEERARQELFAWAREQGLPVPGREQPAPTQEQVAQNR